MQRFLNPKNDFVFKRLFGTEKNKGILIQFLNDVFEGKQDTIEDVEFLKSNQDPEVATLRQSIVDVMCRDSKGNRFIIEMQCATDTHFIQRAVAYACRAYLNQKTGAEGYGIMKPVIFFAIMKRTLFKDKAEYLSHHRVTDVCTGENDIKNLSFSFLELSKFRKKSINELETNVERWAYFFKNAQSTSPEDLERLERDDKLFWRAYTALAEYNYTPEELLEYERYEMKQDEIATSLSDAEARGRAKGREEGKLKGKREMALELLLAGVDPDIVVRTSGLSPDEIESFRNSDPGK
ncbi:MAG: Rpn family recombination-promoting nuclease/putative transposase [Holosporaceae bacterium]|jgi:predicted transposase/invertase (TIGR01784 family)|nr:Rpn family recombination-promoting nuclease/putative transposase [Holosporaceae bacterium]